MIDLEEARKLFFRLRDAWNNNGDIGLDEVDRGHVVALALCGEVEKLREVKDIAEHLHILLHILPVKWDLLKKVSDELEQALKELKETP